jgi:hypothetical protein
MSYRYLIRLNFLVRFKNRPITRTAILLNIRFILKTLDLRYVTSGDDITELSFSKFEFSAIKITSAPQNTCNEFTEISFT